eukprot:9213583-Alexandrium_andersonii.AAC.1
MTLNAASAQSFSRALGVGLPLACSAISDYWASRQSSLTCMTLPRLPSAELRAGRTRPWGVWTSSAATGNWTATFVAASFFSVAHVG